MSAQLNLAERTASDLVGEQPGPSYSLGVVDDHDFADDGGDAGLQGATRTRNRNEVQNKRPPMKLSRATIYAIMAVIQMSDSTTAPPVSCSRLSRLGRMPERFLLQILRSLVTHGICVSTRGVDGGYRLAKPLSQITLLEVVEATDGPLGSDLEPIAGLARQSHERLGDLLRQAATDVRKRLASIPLSQLKTVAVGD